MTSKQMWTSFIFMASGVCLCLTFISAIIHSSGFVVAAFMFSSIIYFVAGYVRTVVSNDDMKVQITKELKASKEFNKVLNG